MSRVSSPHRYCPNEVGRTRKENRDGVSSPHRYCPNKAAATALIREMEGFQALIGTVQTSSSASAAAPARSVSSPHRYCPNRQPGRDRAAAPWFQALIGTVQTAGGCGQRRQPGREFQALIGTVQTGCGSPSVAATCRVSSPHRYCPNMCATSYGSMTSTCFKPS